MRVSDLHDDYTFISDSQDIKPIQEQYRNQYANNYDSFFVMVGDGEYTSIYGMFGIVPDLNKLVFEINPKEL